MTSLVLASASPRRVELLAQIGLRPDQILPANIDETPLPSERPRAYACRMGRQKAKAVHQQGQFTLAGDTVVALGQRILPKAETRSEVEHCLELISGRAHQVLSAVCVMTPDNRLAERLCVTKVRVKSLSIEEKRLYAAQSEGLGKAGGYAIQGLFGAYIRALSGSYSGVMGLPVYETLQLLRGLGYPWPQEAR